MTDREELGEYFERLNEAINSCIEIQHRLIDIGLMYPASRNKRAAISELALKANKNMAWVNTRIAMECFHMDNKD